jgi:hypothetical protein
VYDNETAPPVLEQAEAYFRDAVVAIRNPTTENVLDITQKIFNLQIKGVSDFSEFLATISEFDSLSVVVALGDSTTANVTNWPRFLLGNPRFIRRDILVLNLAGWSTSVGEHVRTVEFIVPWLSRHFGARPTVVFCGGVVDLARRLFFHTEFVRGRRESPLISIENSLEAHEEGAAFRRLNRLFPVESGSIGRWIVRRFMAAVGILERVCNRNEAPLIAALQPLCYEDYSPGYSRALRRLHEAETPTKSLEDWCLERGYSIDLSFRFSRGLEHDLRPIVEMLRAAWHSEITPSSRAHYVDYAELFRYADACCFARDFDGIHYDPIGSQLIADAIAGILP